MAYRTQFDCVLLQTPQQQQQQQQTASRKQAKKRPKQSTEKNIQRCSVMVYGKQRKSLYIQVKIYVENILYNDRNVNANAKGTRQVYTWKAHLYDGV